MYIQLIDLDTFSIFRLKVILYVKYKSLFASELYFNAWPIIKTKDVDTMSSFYEENL